MVILLKINNKLIGFTLEQWSLLRYRSEGWALKANPGRGREDKESAWRVWRKVKFERNTTPEAPPSFSGNFLEVFFLTSDEVSTLSPSLSAPRYSVTTIRPSLADRLVIFTFSFAPDSNVWSKEGVASLENASGFIWIISTWKGGGASENLACLLISSATRDEENTALLL